MVNRKLTFKLYPNAKAEQRLTGWIIAKGTGQPLLDFARGRLFSPLGIEKVDLRFAFPKQATSTEITHV